MDHLGGAKIIGMIPEAEIWQVAHQVIEEHGDGAELEAAWLADYLLDRGDVEGQCVWLRIRRAIVALQAKPDVPPH